MKIEELRRDETECAPPGEESTQKDDPRLLLLQEARSLLGVHNELSALYQSQTATKCRRELLASCDAVGCPRPFIDADVQRYLDSKVPPEGSWWHAIRRGWHGSVALAALLGLFALLAASTGTPAGLQIAYGLVCLAITSAATGLLLWRLSIRHGANREWVAELLPKFVSSYESGYRSYNGPIPDFALQTAVDLRKHNPNLWFGVLSLREQERVTTDPFLYAVDVRDNSQTRHYLEVWDERGARISRDHS